MSAPLISVIIVCRNPGERIRDAVESFREQKAPDAELVVIDGASSDGTAEWLAAERATIARFRSEPDAGVYDAMNRGLAEASGKWVLFLGADDRLASATLFETIRDKLAVTHADVVVGEIVYDDGRTYALAPKPRPIARNFVHHQGAFYRRSLFSGTAPFDTSLKIMADYDFNLRLWTNRRRFAPLPVRVALCASSGLSDSGTWQGYREEIAVRHRYYPPGRCALWDLASWLRYQRKKRLRRTDPAQLSPRGDN